MGGPFLLTAFSGLLLAGALPHLDWGWLAWIGLVPFLSLFPFKNKRTAFAHGFTLGVFYLGVMAYWVGVFAGHIIGPALSVVGWALVTAYQAFYLGVWALGAQLLRGRGVWAWRLGVPALWAIVEWWRQSGTLGLGWGDLAYTQHLALPILQVTKLTGIWGLAFLIVLVNVAQAEVFTGLNPRASKVQAPACAGEDTERGFVPTKVGSRSFKAWGFSPMYFPGAVVLIVAATLVYGAVTIRTERLRPTFVAAALQANINQNVDQSPAYTRRVVRTFTEQSQEAAELGAKLTVWPETAYPGFLQNFDATRAQVAAEAVRDRQVALIGGIEYDWAQHKSANSLFLMDPLGNVDGSYQKRQLVPFGEFVPGRGGMPFLEALHVTTFDMKRGAETQALLDGGPDVGKIGATICFESSYPRFLREQVARGAGLLVISTDDTWFGWTAAARQHSAIAAVRAAETDRYLIRSAATGVSQIVSPTGQVLAEAGLFQPAVVAAPVQSRTTVTPYVRWGDWFIGFCVVLVVGTYFLAARTHLLASQGSSRNGRTRSKSRTEE
ncbi:MAG: apolipoprotein N-acyltransferase [Janthinobacterium lividum]